MEPLRVGTTRAPAKSDEYSVRLPFCQVLMFIVAPANNSTNNLAWIQTDDPAI
jgi:hypothetical protein